MKSDLSYKTSDIEKLYKEQSVKYSSFADTSFSWLYLEKPLLDKVLSLKHTKSLKILDAGCGNGRALKYLLSKGIKKENILGTDISKEILEIAKRNVPEVKTVKSDLVNLKINDHFDLIICTHVLHYLDDKDFKKALRNFFKLLNRGGILYFVITHPVRTVRSNLTDYFKRSWIVDHTPWGTDSPLFLRPVSDMVNSVIKAGFTIKSLEEPSVPVEAKKKDAQNYAKYSCCPSRVAVIAVKDKSSN